MLKPTGQRTPVRKDVKGMSESYDKSREPQQSRAFRTEAWEATSPRSWAEELLSTRFVPRLMTFLEPCNWQGGPLTLLTADVGNYHSLSRGKKVRDFQPSDAQNQLLLTFDLRMRCAHSARPGDRGALTHRRLRINKRAPGGNVAPTCEMEGASRRRKICWACTSGYSFISLPARILSKSGELLETVEVLTSVTYRALVYYRLLVYH
ncbi:hypothetical protein J6590_013245 [Homalodisca vitripennis]|nr:hypothetical protein J6590_013245 [Homalodisca vitripennis]